MQLINKYVIEIIYAIASIVLLGIHFIFYKIILVNSSLIIESRLFTKPGFLAFLITVFYTGAIITSINLKKKYDVLYTVPQTQITYIVIGLIILFSTFAVYILNLQLYRFI